MDWIKHQLAVWRYGVGLLIVLGMFAFLWSAIGGMALYLVTWLFGFPFTGWGWAIATALVAPFWLPGIAESFGRMVKESPPPSERLG